MDKKPQASHDHRGCGRVHRPEAPCHWGRLVSRPVDGDAEGLARAEHRPARQHRFELIGDQIIHTGGCQRGSIDQHRGHSLGGVACHVAGRRQHHIALPIHKNPQAPGDRRGRGRVHAPQSALGWRRLIGGPIHGHAKGLARAKHGTARQHRF